MPFFLEVNDVVSSINSFFACGLPGGGRRCWNGRENSKLWWSWAVKRPSQLFEVLSNQPIAR